ncbi:uncharacterized protein [Apostichopus japonicus]|uniref:uncharacterized protein n=1 Tax=Stichopus japonicus TaxID=307972 RepID=UPI003AB17AAD
MDGFIVSKFFHLAIFLVLYTCNVIGCYYYCTEGQTVNSKKCYAMLGCDFSFPDIAVHKDHFVLYINKIDVHLYGLRVVMNFTGRTNGDVPSKETYFYNGLQRRQNQTVNRYLFQVEVQYIEEDRSDYMATITNVDFSFSILNLQRQDAGTYHLSLTDEGSPYLYSHHTYHLFTVDQPPTPLVCQGPSSSPSGSYHVTIYCSIKNGFAPINLEMIEPEGCDFQKHYTDDNAIQELSIYVTSCDQNSTIGCIATQESLASFSSPQYSDRCEFNISKSNPVYQPPSPLVCEGPSSSPSASYHVVLSCSITDGYPSINLEVIKPDGCDYQKHYTDNNGTKELSVYVTSCDKNSIVGCIATHEPLESLSTSQFDDRCEFNISRTDQDTKNIMTLLMIVIAVILVVSVIAIVYVYSHDDIHPHVDTQYTVRLQAHQPLLPKCHPLATLTLNASNHSSSFFGIGNMASVSLLKSQEL